MAKLHGIVSEHSTVKEIDTTLATAEKLIDFFGMVVEAMLVHPANEVEQALMGAAQDQKGILDGADTIPAARIEAMEALLPAFAMTRVAWKETIAKAREHNKQANQLR